MDKAREFYSKHIKELPHIIGGSTAVKKQIPTFRTPNDIDVMIEKELAPTVRNIIKGYELSESNYGNGIFSVLFDDSSKIDLMLSDMSGDIADEFEGVMFLKLGEIIKHKFALIDRSINRGCFNEHNKHLKDLIFIFDNLGEHQISKIKKEQAKCAELPF